jgi:hypothetical protein
MKTHRIEIGRRIVGTYSKSLLLLQLPELGLPAAIPSNRHNRSPTTNGSAIPRQRSLGHRQRLHFPASPTPLPTPPLQRPHRRRRLHHLRHLTQFPSPVRSMLLDDYGRLRGRTDGESFE